MEDSTEISQSKAVQGDDEHDDYHEHYHKHKHKHEYKLSKKEKEAMTQVLDVQRLGGMGTDGGFGLGGGGLLGGLLIGALLGRRGGLFGGDDGGSALNTVENTINTDVILSNLADIKAAVPLAEAQVQLALAQATADINTQNLQQTISLMNGQTQIQSNLAAGFNATQRELCEVGKSIASTVVSEGEKTRSLISAIDRENLNRIITTQASELAELHNESGRSEDRHGLEITMINNQNQNQLQFQQQNQVLGLLANGLSEAVQNIRATNQAINIGGGTLLASPTNTNTNLRT